MNRMGMGMGDDESLMEVSERLLEESSADEFEDDAEEDEGPAEEYERCQRCSNHVDVLQRAIRERDDAAQEMERWEHNIVNYDQEMANHRQLLAQAYQALP